MKYIGEFPLKDNIKISFPLKGNIGEFPLKDNITIYFHLEGSFAEFSP